MVLYKDFAKASSDLLKRDFAHEKPWDIECKHKAENPKFTQTASLSPSGLFEAASSAKYDTNGHSLEAKVGTHQSMLNARYRAGLVDGLIIAAKFERKQNGGGASSGKAATVTDNVEIAAEYEHPSRNFHGRMHADPVAGRWAASGVCSYDPKNVGRMSLGGEVSGGYDIHSLKYSMGVSFAQKQKASSWILSCKTAPHNGSPFGKLIGNLHAKTTLGGASEMGAELTHSVVDSKTGLCFGGLWHLGSGSSEKDTYLKARMTHDAKFAAALTHKFSNAFWLTVGAQMDGMKASAADSLRCGAKVRLTA